MSESTEKKLPKTGWNGEPLFERQEVLEIPVKYSNKMSLLMHTEMVTGKHKGKDFRLILDIGNRGMRLSWDGQQIDIDTRELVTALMTKFELLRKAQKVHAKRKAAANGKD